LGASAAARASRSAAPLNRVPQRNLGFHGKSQEQIFSALRR
jgi:hypothetical protein